MIEGDYRSSISALEQGFSCTTEIYYPELQMFFATSILQVHLMQWDDVNLVKRAVKNCDEVWEMIPPEKTAVHWICDYKNAKQHDYKLVAAVKSDLEKRKGIQDLTTELNSINQSLSQSDLKNNERSALSTKQTQIQEHLKTVACTESLESSYFGNVREIWGDKLELAPAPIDEEWLPKADIYALVDLVFLENKAAIELTHFEFSEAQEALVEMKSWFVRFSTILQYLTILGSLALTLHDTGQAREILKSSLTLAKTLYDIPTQIWVLSVLTMLYQELSERGNEMENSEYEREKIDDLQKRLTDARSSIHHIKLIKRLKIEARPLHDTEMKRATAGPSVRVNLDISESIGLTTPAPVPSTRLMDIYTGRRGKRKI
ncbi:hypothetical protein GIB67_034828 [Kingdonia uniflora]|uniref:Uncharacterized protein n=1 Tax=Kingdonia uniflora TaxID=39325 RepID=A0A7J7MDY3_9MAGN|nr:hypothetical protein GIB67_034828 [Kingdonia uniflora]